MAEKVISIMIGPSVTQVAEVDYGAKNPKIHHAFSFETPEGTVDDNTGIQISDILLGQIRNGMTGAGMKSEKVIFTLTSARVATRDVTIPMVKEKKIQTVLTANSKDYFPVDLTEFQLVYRIIEKQKAQKQIKLLVFAVPNSMVQSYVRLAEELELKLVAVDYLGNSIYQAMMKSMSPDVSATICVNDNNTLVTVIRDSQIVLQRTIGYGIDDAVFQLTRGPFARSGMTYTDALYMLQQNQYIGDTLRGARDDNMVVRRGITNALSMLVGNISRVLDYYFSRNSDVELTRIGLIGVGADCRGLDRLLSNELDVYVETIRRFGNMDIGKGAERHGFHLAEYYSCFGSAFKPLSFRFDSLKDKTAGRSMRMPALIFVGCIAVSAVVLGTQFMSNLMLESDNSSLRRELQSKQASIDVYNEYITNKMVNQEMQKVDDSSNGANNLFLDFLGEMESAVPKDLIVANITTSETEIMMTLRCSSMVSAADTIVQIRQFKTVDVVSCTQVTDEEDDDGIRTVQFSLTLSYNQSMLNEDETADTGLEGEDNMIEEGGEGTTEATE